MFGEHTCRIYKTSDGVPLFNISRTMYVMHAIFKEPLILHMQYLGEPLI